MDDAPGADTFGITCRVGHIIAMRQEDVPDAASFFEPAGQVFDKTEAD